MATKKRQPGPNPSQPSSPGAPARKANGWLIAVGAAAAAAVVAVLAFSAGGDGGGGGDGATGGDADQSDQVADGLLRTGPPWPPRYDGLEARVEAAGFPPVGDESYHVHALLSVFVEGEAVEVPGDIGIDRPRQFLSPLHTHSANGVIHFEADDPAPFTLGQVFDVWGVAFDTERLGGLTNVGPDTVQVFVDGEPVQDPRSVELAEGDNVVVAYGEEGSFATRPPSDALANP